MFLDGINLCKGDICSRRPWPQTVVCPERVPTTPPGALGAGFPWVFSGGPQESHAGSHVSGHSTTSFIGHNDLWAVGGGTQTRLSLHFSQHEAELRMILIG